MAVPIVTMHVDAHVTYVDKEGPVIKLFAQTDKNNAIFVERFLYQLRDVFEKCPDLKPKSVNDLHVGLICCAKFEDDVYYRARIVNMDALREYKVTVMFMDHGNINKVNVTDIRLLSKLVHMLKDKRVESLVDLKDLAQVFYLSGISPEKEWDDDTLDLLRKKLCNTDLKCAVYEVEDKKWIKILKSEFDPVSFLINMKKAYPVPLPTQQKVLKKLFETKVQQQYSPHFNSSLPPPQVMMQHPPPMRLPNLAQPPPIRAVPESNSVPGVLPPQSVIRPAGMSVRRPEIQVQVPSQSLQFSTEMLAPGVTHSVFVSHVEDGPVSFAVQLKTMVTEVLTKMMAGLNSLEPQPITAPLNPGSICLGRYSVDNCLCRAIVMNVLDDKVKLYFADFGNSEVVPFSEIYQIPPQFVTPKVMSHRFTLANITGKVYTEQEKKWFKDLVANSDALMIKVTPPEANPLKQYCELFIHCKNIKTVLQEMAQSQTLVRYSYVTMPIIESQEKVFVSFVLNPGRFFVQLEKNNFSLNQIMRCVADHCKTASHIPLVDQRIGEPCCALYEDNKWYRGEIIKLITDNKAMINFVDFGNQDEIEVANLRQITPELVTSVKAQAVACCLNGYQHRYNVDEDVSNRFEELVLEKTLMLHVLGSTNSNVLIVQLLDDNGQDIEIQLESRPTQTPVYNNHQATTTPAYSPPAKSNHIATDNGWKESSTAPTTKTWEDRKQSNTQGASDDVKRSWRSREDNDTAPRFNKDSGHWNDATKSERSFKNDGEEKSWNRNEGRFNREDSKSGRFTRDEESGGRFNRDESKKFDRGGRFGDVDKGGRFNRDSTESRGGGRFNEDNGSRFTSEERGDRGSRYNNEDRTNRFSHDDRGGRSSNENRGGRFDKNEDERPWKKRDDDAGGWRGNKEKSDWKDRESSGTWNKDRDSSWKEKDGGGDGIRRNKFDSGDGGFKKGGGFSRDSGDRSSFRKPWDKGGDSFEKPTPKTPPKPDTMGGMPFSLVKVGLVEDTQVVYTTSALEFYVQLTSSFEDLNQLMDRIASACESGDATDMDFVEEKCGCLAKYSEDDTWYRAFIEEKSFDTVKVLFVDYGNQENVPLDKIKKLPEDMCVLPVQAIKCQLFGVPETADTDAFTAFVDGKTLKTQFVAKNFLSKSFQVILVDEETSTNINIAMGAPEKEVTSALAKLGSVTLLPSHFTAGTTLTAQLTWYLSPSNFYLQPMASNLEFRAMMQNMQSIVRTGTVKQNNELNVGDHVIARFKVDKVLYRALVKETGFVPVVQYVDYGNCEAVDSGSVWALEPEYSTLPIQAFSCCLAGVQPIGEVWPKADTTELDAQFEAETLECIVVRELEADPCYLVKLTKQGEDVAQKIIDAGFATAGSDAIGVPSELDTSLLVGQALPVTLLRIDEDNTFFVQPAVEDIELQSLEISTGEGIKCVLSCVREDYTDDQRLQFQQLAPNSYVILLVDAVQTDGLQGTLYDGEGQLLSIQTSEILTQPVVCPMPVLNTHQRVWISHASEDGIFLHKVIYADLLSELLQKLYDFYNESEPSEQEWTVSDVCCALSLNDEQWYRAIIIEVGAEIKVRYLDYGNTEALPASNLRKLDPSFYCPHAYALQVSLHVSWTVPVENLLELAAETEYSAVILRSKDGWIVELVDSSGQSLTEKLVELGFAVALKNSPFKRVVEGGRFVEGSNITISFSCIDNPLQLWITVVDDIELIEALQDRLQEAAPKLLPLKEPTGLFAIKYTDDLWYRAVKLNDSTVRFIDYGDSHEVNMSDIKTLSADFLEPAEGYAVKVELPVVDFVEGATERIDELLNQGGIVDSEEEVIAHILSVKESFIVANIIKGGKSIVDILVEEKLCTRLQKIVVGFVSHINSLSDFFVQEIGCEESLEEMASAMMAAESFEPLHQINVGDIVAALYDEDGQWYRAKIISKLDTATEALFIDYGNSATVIDFRTLPHDLAVKPALSKHCALQLPKEVMAWSETANDKFIGISAEGCTQFDVKFLNEEDPATVRLFLNGKCLTEELKPFCEVVVNETVSYKDDPIDLTSYNKTVYITHINSTNDFYVQFEGAEEELDVIKEELVDSSSFEALPLTTDIEGKLVGALFDDDGLWYRAKVIKTMNDEVEVLFVDYGNTSRANKIVKLTDNLENKNPVAYHCTLGEETWPKETISYFEQLSGDGTVPFQMKLISEGELNVVSLSIGGKFVENELKDFIAKSSIEEVTKHEESNLSSCDSEKVLENSIVDDVIKKVYLIQVNSPSDFFIHTAEATQLIDKISDQLTSAEEFQSVEGAVIGNIVAAQFDEDDLWYRAKVIDHNENETKVLFIDYGNSAKVAKMKHLPDDLLSTPPLALHCSLQMPGGNEWSLKACETFIKLANDESVSFDMKIETEGEPNIVVLYINGESVVEQLILMSGMMTEEAPTETETDSTNAIIKNNCEPDKASTVEINFSESDAPKNIIDNKNIQDIINENDQIDNDKNNCREVKISHYNDPNDFYVQFTDDENKLATVINEMLQADNFETMLDAEDILAAKYTCNNLWYRAKIVDTSDSGSSVLFVDFGFTNIANEFRKLPKHLSELKPLAKHCSLKLPSTDSLKSIDENLSKLIKNKDMTYNMQTLVEGNPCIVELFVNGYALTQTFLLEELQSGMKEILLEFIDDKIYKQNIENVKAMQEITNEIVFNAVYSSHQDAETASDSISNQDSKKPLSPSPKEIKYDVVESNSQCVEKFNNTNSILDSVDFSNRSVDELHECQLSVKNGNEKNSNVNKLETDIEPNVETLSEDHAKTVSNDSPPTPRRFNIDDHIVPGCISSTNLDKEQS